MDKEAENDDDVVEDEEIKNDDDVVAVSGAVSGELGAVSEIMDEESEHDAMENRMRAVVEAHQAASIEFSTVCKNLAKVENKLWVAKAAAKRNHSKVDRNLIMSFMEAQAERDRVSQEIRLYANELSNPENQSAAMWLGFQGHSSRR